eukprot:m.68196 g.68196  ORF g.68196 m.68196 type:complete len:582 (+) comp35498_c0_seq4:2-1747(+)
MNRVVTLVDMDCFYVQVEKRLDPSLVGKPCVVAQYNAYRGGSIIAVDYEARKFGVTRRMGVKCDDAKKQCPSLQIVRVVEKRGKADLTKYRKASSEVMRLLSRFGDCMERASIDEAYIDLTETVDRKMKTVGVAVPVEELANTHVVGWEANEKGKDKDKQGEEVDEDGGGTLAWISSGLSMENRRLALGACIAEEIRRELFKETGFSCSAGIAHNKVLAKLACGLHKPNQQTICPMESVPDLFQNLPFKKVRNLGGKLGYLVEEQLNISHVGDLCQFERAKLQEKLGEKNGAWLYNICRGLDSEPVRPRLLPKSIGCSKNFPGSAKLASHEQVKYWLLVFAEEISERLEEDQAENNRIAKHLTIHCYYDRNEGRRPNSRSCLLLHLDPRGMAEDAYAALVKSAKRPDIEPSSKRGPTPWVPGLACLGLVASQFEDIPSSAACRIDRFLSPDVDPTASRPLPGRSPRKRKQAISTPVSISKFFQKEDSQLADGDLSKKEKDRDGVVCEKCGKIVESGSVQEHEDYHFARQLQIEERSSGTRIETSKEKVNSLTAQQQKTTLRKTKKLSRKPNQITQFFSKTQ